MHPIRRAAATVALAVMLHATLADAALAATRNWAAPINGFAGTAANWNPAVVPTSSDSCVYDFNSSYDVSFANLVPTVAAQIVDWGHVGLILNTPHTVSANAIVGRTAGIPCSLSVREGSLSLLGNTFVGGLSGTTGVMRVDSGTSAALFGTNATAVIGENGGIGTLLVAKGGFASLGSFNRVGWNGGNGTLRVVGTNDSVPSDRSTLIANGGGGVLALGNIGGTGRLEVTDGAWFVGTSILLAPDATSTGSLHVGGASTEDSARVSLQNDLLIGRNFLNGIGSGAGSVTVAAGGVLEVSGKTFTFDPSGTVSGQLTIRGGSRMITSGLYLSDPTTDLRFTGGRLQIRGDSLSLQGHRLDLNGDSGTPRLDLINGASCVVNSGSAPALRVGRTGSAQLRVLGGSNLFVHDFNAQIGDSAGSNGAIEVSDVSTLTVDEVLLVGRAGTGTLNVNIDGQVLVDQLGVSTAATGNGTVTIATGGLLRATTDLQLAGVSSGASGATGLIQVEGGGLLDLRGFPSSGTVWDGGTLAITNGGRANFAGTLVHHGTLDLTDGAVDGVLLSMQPGSVLTGSGDVHASVLSTGDTTASIVSGTELTMGHEAFPLGYAFGGTLTVGAGHVTLRDADSAAVGSVILLGGKLTGPAGGTFLPAGRRLAGNGTIEGTFRPSGYVLATGVGLSFSGAVLRTGQGMNGSKFRFLPGGSFLGRGRIEATVQVDSGAVMAPIGDVTLGNALAASSVTLDGTGLVGPGVEWDLDGTDTTRVNGLLRLARGFVFPNLAPLLIRTGGRLAGNGDITGGTIVAGALDPGAASETGRLGFAQLRMRNSSVTTFDVGAFATGDRDTLAATANAALGGQLDFRLGSGFAPAIGDSFLVLSAPSVTGTFSSVTIAGSPATGWIQLRYRANAVWAHVIGAGLDAPTGDAPRALRFAALGSPSHTLAFALDLPRASDATVELFDVGGRRLATLHRGPLAAGAHRLTADDDAAPEGGLVFARAVLRDAAGTTTRTARAVKLR